MADDQEWPSPGQQVRAIMWSVPRSTSTVLAKCLSFVEDALIFFEPYICAHYIGPDKALADVPNAELEAGIDAMKKSVEEAASIKLNKGFDVSQCSYKWVKEQLEEAHAGKKFIFCKDMAYGIAEKHEFIPNGYRHVFLVRHPLKVFPSWKKVFQFFINVPLDAFHLDELPSHLLPAGYSYGELSELLDHVKEVHDQDAIIIDADDLLDNPKGILSALFKAIGLPFEEKILHWEAGDVVTKQWVASNIILQGNQLGSYYKTAFESTRFTKPRDLPDRSSLSPDILRCVDASMPYYEKMYAQRLKPE